MSGVTPANRDNKMGTRILVTGGAGFIGGHLCERLLRDGFHVICFDNFCTSSSSNIAHLLDHPRFVLMYGDVTAPFHAEVDFIFNLACPASPVHYQRDAVQTMRTNVLGIMNALDLAMRLQARVLQASTSEVYGDPIQHPQREAYWGNVNPIGPRACYDEGKRCAETLCFDYFRQYGLRIKVARIFNTYGPRMQFDDGRVVSNFVLQALRAEPLTLYGDGSQTRAFCYVDDTVEGLMRLMHSDDGFNGPVNLGNPQECSMLELAARIIAECDSTSCVVSKPLPQDDPRQRMPDISLAQKALGWAPVVALEEGLRLTVADFRKRLFVGDAAEQKPAGLKVGCLSENA